MKQVDLIKVEKILKEQPKFTDFCVGEFGGSLDFFNKWKVMADEDGYLSLTCDDMKCCELREVLFIFPPSGKIMLIPLSGEFELKECWQDG